MAYVLLIDDDPALIPEQVRQAFPPLPVAGSRWPPPGAKGLEQVSAGFPDVILLDVHLPDQSGLEVYEGIRRIDARIPVIFVTTARTADTAIEAMKLGAYDYLFKPLDLNQLRRVVGEAFDVAQRMRAPAVLPEAAPDPDVDGAIVGSCPGVREVYKAIGRVAGQDVTVLISGETGTGKELIARAIYQHSLRAKAPFMALNCAAIPENLLESELFGHEKGAFTGADRRRIGKFEQCNHGTIMLDEVGDMPLALQAKLLRLIQEQSFERVGGNETVRTDVRLIAASHRDLKALSAEGKFRADLYYRLSVFTIHLPPLRDRGEDLPMLVRHFLRRFGRELGARRPAHRPRGDGAAPEPLLARQHPRAAERPQTSSSPGARLGPAPHLPRRPRRDSRARPEGGSRPRGAIGERHRRVGGVHPPASATRFSGSLRPSARRTGPLSAGVRARIHPREPAPGGAVCWASPGRPCV